MEPRRSAGALNQLERPSARSRRVCSRGLRAGEKDAWIERADVAEGDRLAGRPQQEHRDDRQAEGRE